MTYIPANSANKVSSVGGDVTQTVVSATGVTTRPLGQKLDDMPTLYDYVTASDNTSDWGPVITRGLAAGHGLLIPGSVDLPFSTITFPSNTPATLSGFGPNLVRLRPIQGTNSAGHIIVPPSGESNAVIRDISILFAQPDVSTGFIQYVPAIYLNNAARVKLEGIKIAAGWDGIVGNANCGGLTCNNLESSCLHTNIVLDGCLDTVRFNNPHIWPFDLTSNQSTAFETTSNGYVIGRVDDLHIVSGLTFMRSAMAFNVGVDGNGTFGSISNHDFDAFGGLNVVSAHLLLGQCYFTLGDAYATCFTANDPRANVTLSGCTFLINVVPVNTVNHSIAVVGSGANVIINGCRFDMGADAVSVLVDGPNTTCVMTGNSFIRGASTRPAVQYGSGALPLFTGNNHSVLPAGNTTTFISSSSDTAGVIANNVFGNTALDARSVYTQLVVNGNAGVRARTA